MTPDLRLFYFLNGFAGQNPAVDALILFWAAYSQYVLIAAFLAFLFFSRSARGRKMRILAVSLGSVIIARLGVTELIRLAYHRPRPFMFHEARQLISETGYSFPSGHAAFFFALAAAICFYDRRWGIFFLAMSFLMGIGRVMAGAHYPSDIIGGIIVGSVVGYAAAAVAAKIGWRESDKKSAAAS